MSTETIDSASMELWESAKSFLIMTLKTQEEKSQAERYMGMITSVESDGKKFTIYTNNEFTADFLKKDYSSKLRGSFMVAGNDRTFVHYTGLPVISSDEFRFDPSSKRGIHVRHIRERSFKQLCYFSSRRRSQQSS